MGKVRILAISPYEGMKEVMLSVAAQRDDIELTVHVGDLEEGVEIALDASRKSDYDIIISRGGTAELIRNVIDIPLLEVSISVEDILQAIKLAENYQGKFAIIGFTSIIDQVNIICDLLQYKIDSYIIHNANEVPALIKKLKDDDYSMVLCDMITFTVARSFGLNAILINSGFESIKNIFRQSVKLYHNYSKISEKNKFLELAIKHNSTFTFIYTNEEELLFSSLDINEKNEIIYSWIKKSFCSFLEHETYRIEKKINNKHFIIMTKKVIENNQTLIIVYLTINSATLPFKEESVTIYNNSEQDVYQFDHYYHTSSSINNNIRTTIEQYSQSSLPVLIVGEVGTGKDSAANFLYQKGSHKNNPLYIVDCSNMSKKNFVTLLETSDSPFNSSECTIYFKNIEKLAEPIIKSFNQLIERSDFYRRNRIIFSLETDNRTDENNFICDLLLKNVCLTLSLPPLRQRVEDMQSLTVLYINQFNFQLGKEIIGFNPEAFLLMKSFYWQQNLDQFKRVLKELIVTTNQFYISKESVQNCLNKEKLLFLTDFTGKANDLNLNQTLENINYDIIRIIMEEENMNQKKVAARLGLSRSTIWRILKSKS